MSINRIRRPSHPGAVLGDLLPDAGLSQTQLAERLGVSRRTVNEIINERRPVTVDMAHRLSRVFNTSPDVWLDLQRDVDVWEALEEHRREYDKIRSLVAAA
jgi:addiction module HigA family antidote